MDYAILKPILDFMAKPDNTTFEELLQDCLNAWGKACQGEYEFQMSEEYIADAMEANEYDFTEDGKRY